MTITPQTPVSDLKNVGPRRSAALARLGIKTVDDLLHHYPTGYVFAPPVTSIGPEVELRGVVTIVGVVTQLSHTYVQNKFAVTLEDDRGFMFVSWFGSGYLRECIFRGSRLMVSGKVDAYGMTNPAFKVLKPDEVPNSADLNTVTYPETAGITSRDIGRLVNQVLHEMSGGVNLSLINIHQPFTQEDANTARRVLKYDELFYMQLGLAMRQSKREQEPVNVQCLTLPTYWGVDRYFPFEFTCDQRSAIEDILSDLHCPRAMNRLLQGDVGCGKTAVAAYAAIVTAFNGAQTAILCPTEILARQHYETIRGYFERAGAKCHLWLGGNCPGTHFIDCNLAQIIIGTTALLHEELQFEHLGLVIIDEQHKFGVEQRAALRRHGNLHVLVMTATPIPRTIAMTVFGDLDISTIRSMPPGRRSVETYWCRDGMSHQHMRDTLQSELAAGHQVYVVCPRIEALDDEMRAVEEVQEEYYKLFPEASISSLHGRRTTYERQSVMDWWNTPMTHGKILVSTTVVEVGVDNPNATVMVVEGAERFGLAQLWQLHGRVGRGEHQSYCFLLSDTDSQEARTRLRAMETATSGFEIAEIDLKLRGPGSLLSTEQHGLPNLRIADLLEDYDLLLQAREEARKIVAGDPALDRHPEMMIELKKRFGDKLLLGDAA